MQSMADMLANIENISGQTVGDVNDQLKDIPYPKAEEPAMVHPLTSAIVKLRNNGMIDIFVTDDNGIRIDPSTKTINLLANGIKEQASYHMAWLDNYKAWVNNNWSIEVSGSVQIKAQGEISMESGSHITLTAPQIDIN